MFVLLFIGALSGYVLTAVKLRQYCGRHRGMRLRGRDVGRIVIFILGIFSFVMIPLKIFLYLDERNTCETFVAGLFLANILIAVLNFFI